MGWRIYYQTKESVSDEELSKLKELLEKFNVSRRSAGCRIKLWRKCDILDCLSPMNSRWGFTIVHDAEEREALMEILFKMSEATPRLTWLLLDEGNGGKEVVVRGGRLVGEVIRARGSLMAQTVIAD